MEFEFRGFNLSRDLGSTYLVPPHNVVTRAQAKDTVTAIYMTTN